jgi:quinol monooxygenase YgiN
MLLIEGTVRIPSENVAAARSAMAAVLAASRAEDGCIAYAYAEDVLVPGLIHIAERWRDEAALKAHFAQPHMAEWRATWSSLGITDRDLRLYEVGEPRPV